MSLYLFYFAVEFKLNKCYINNKKEHPLQSGCSRKGFRSKDPASPVCRQERHFYFFLFLLSRKARNATIKLPKATSKLNIPIITEIISKAVIITHRLRSRSGPRWAGVHRTPSDLPSYVIWLGRLPLHFVPVGAKLTSPGRHAPCHGYSSYVNYHAL